MSPLIAAALYFIIWWLTLFMVLPWGVRREESVEEGNDPGAPQRSRIALKLVVNSLLALVIWGAILAVIELELISLDRIG